MSTTPHLVAPEEVMAFLDGELPADRTQAASFHLEQCAECRETRDFIWKTRQSVANWTVAVAPMLLEDHVLKSPVPIRNLPADVFISRLRRFLRGNSTLVWRGAVFAVLLIFLDLSFYRTSRQAGPGLGPSAIAGKRLRTLPLQERGRNPGPVDSALMAPPMIARTVAVSIVVKDFDAGRASLDAFLARHNGYTATLNAKSPLGAARTLEASLRVPALQLDSALREIKSLGRVEGESQNGEEVTQQHADLIARIKNDRETELRLQDILRTRTGKVKDVLEVEQEIARVRGEIEQMEAEQKNLEHRVEFARIDLNLAEEYKAQLDAPAPSALIELRNATINGFRNAFGSLLAVVLFFAESGPSLFLWLALLGLPAWRLWRRYRRAQGLGSLAGT